MEKSLFACRNGLSLFECRAWDWRLFFFKAACRDVLLVFLRTDGIALNWFRLSRAVTFLSGEAGLVVDKAICERVRNGSSAFLPRRQVSFMLLIERLCLVSSFSRFVTKDVAGAIGREKETQCWR